MQIDVNHKMKCVILDVTGTIQPCYMPPFQLIILTSFRVKCRAECTQKISVYLSNDQVTGEQKFMWAVTELMTNIGQLDDQFAGETSLCEQSPRKPKQQQRSQ